jgi:hypothetical protein
LSERIDEYIKEGEEKADWFGDELKARFGQTAIREHLEARNAHHEG